MKKQDAACRLILFFLFNSLFRMALFVEASKINAHHVDLLYGEFYIGLMAQYRKSETSSRGIFFLNY